MGSTSPGRVWVERFEAKVAAGKRHPRTLEAHRYQLDRHLLPALGRRRVASLTVDDVAELLHELRRSGRSAKTAAGALATLQSVMRLARRCGWIVADPVELLEHDERPRPPRRRQRVLGRAEIERLLAACSPRDRLMLATVLYTGLRISEMLGLVWDDVDLATGVIHVRAPARPARAASTRDSARNRTAVWRRVAARARRRPISEYRSSSDMTIGWRRRHHRRRARPRRPEKRPEKRSSRARAARRRTVG